MQAVLPMYDLPELRSATDGWWHGIAAHLRRIGLPDVPVALGRPRDYAASWLLPDLLLGQTCGYPLTHALAGKVRLVATPRYGAAGCLGSDYSSWIVVRDDDPALTPADLRGRLAAVNTPDSQSGMNALRDVFAPLAEGGRFFSAVVETGGHVASLEAVARGRADVAAIDCVTFALLERVRPAATRGIRKLAQTAAVPSLPYISSLRTGPQDLTRLREGLRDAAADPGLAGVRGDLLIEGFDVRPERDYDSILEMERRAGARAYATIG